MAKFVTIAGNIGVGKSTFARFIHEEYGYRLFEEPVIDNPFLESYYKDMKRWAYTLQMHFLYRRASHLKSIEIAVRKEEVNCVQDRSLIEDPAIFARYLHTIGKMSLNEYHDYSMMFQLVNEHLIQPDHIIYLENNNIDVLMRRIKEIRARTEEKEIPESFLRGLGNRYHDFPEFCEDEFGVPLVKVPYGDIDIRTSEGKQEIKKQLDEILR